MDVPKIVYSIPINNPDKKPNETSIYRHFEMVNKKFDQHEGLTLIDGFRDRLKHPDKDFIGEILSKNGVQDDFYTWYSNKHCFDLAEKVGSGIINMDMCEEITEYRNMTLKFVGFYSKNTVNFLLSEIACIIYGITIIPIYDTLGEEATLFAFA